MARCPQNICQRILRNLSVPCRLPERSLHRRRGHSVNYRSRRYWRRATCLLKDPPTLQLEEHYGWLRLRAQHSDQTREPDRRRNPRRRANASRSCSTAPAQPTTRACGKPESRKSGRVSPAACGSNADYRSRSWCVRPLNDFFRRCSTRAISPHTQIKVIHAAWLRDPTTWPAGAVVPESDDVLEQAVSALRLPQIDSPSTLTSPRTPVAGADDPIADDGQPCGLVAAAAT